MQKMCKSLSPIVKHLNNLKLLGSYFDFVLFSIKIGKFIMSETFFYLFGKERLQGGENLM